MQNTSMKERTGGTFAKKYFPDLPFLQSHVRQKGVVISSNRRAISFEIGPDMVEFADVDDKYYHLSAYVHDGIAGFACFTTETKGFFRPYTVRHPDFFAREFVEASLDYFGQQGNVIHALRGEWHSDESINYTQFGSAKKRGLSDVAAALSTWTGKTFASLGYGKVDTRDIVQFATTNPWPVQVVQVLFRKG